MDPVEDSGNILDRLKNTYIYLIGFSIIPLILATTLRVDFSRYPYILFWLILEILAEVKPFKSTFYLKMDMTLSFASQMAMVILLDTWEAIWIVIVATIIAGTILRRRRDKVLFYAGQYGLCLLVSSLVFHSLKLSPPGTNLHIIKDLHAVLASVCVYYVLNTFFISVVTSVFSRDRFLDVFFNDLKIMANFYFSVTSISVAASLLYDEQAPYNILILVLPLIMTDQALQRYYSLHKETVETLNVLADIIDERDKNTYLHSLRVAEYSEKIAQELRLSSGAIDEIGTASRVHDIGKIILEDSILKNPGKLQDYEYAKIKQHPVIAHRLLKNLKPYQKGTSYVLYHHERMDGNGYPSNLHGRSIPIGARIIAVADCYDAMTSDRPYRKALPQRVAVEELRKNSGNQFDPLIVEAFIKVLKRDYGYKENSMGQ